MADKTVPVPIGAAVVTSGAASEEALSGPSACSAPVRGPWGGADRGNTRNPVSRGALATQPKAEPRSGLSLRPPGSSQRGPSPPACTRCRQRRPGMLVPVLIEEFRPGPAEHRVGRRVYKQPRGPHPPCVYPPRWPTGSWWCQVTLHGVTTYLGAVDSPAEGAALVAAFKRQKAAAEPAPFPEATVTGRG